MDRVKNISFEKTIKPLKMVNELEHCMCWGFKNSYAYLMTWLNSTKSCYKLSWLTNLFTHRKLYTYFRPVPIIASKQKLCVRRNTPDNFWQYIHVCSSLNFLLFSMILHRQHGSVLHINLLHPMLNNTQNNVSWVPKQLFMVSFCSQCFTNDITILTE